MKTAEEILNGTKDIIFNTSYSQDYIIKAMKIYANQKLDQAANQVIIKDEDNNDHWYECFPIPSVDKESILSLKDSI